MGIKYFQVFSSVLFAGACAFLLNGCASGAKQSDLKPATFNEHNNYNKLLAAGAPDLKRSSSASSAGQGKEEPKTSATELSKEVKSAGAPGEKGRAEIQAVQKDNAETNKKKQPLVKKRAGRRAFANFRGPVIRAQGGGVSVSVPRITMVNGRGGQFALALEAFNISNRRRVARSDFMRINVNHARANARGVNTFTISGSKLRSASSDVTFSLVSYFSPNRRSGWRMTNFIPIGRASLSGGRARVQAYYSSLLTGQNYKWKNIGFGAGHVKNLTFLYNSQKGCMEFSESVTAVGFGMQIANTTSGCVNIRGSQMLFLEQKFCGPRCGRINSRKVYGFRLFSNGIRRVEGRTSHFFRKQSIQPIR